MRCPRCEAEMKLLEMETRGPACEIYTFECRDCGYIEARSLTWASDDRGALYNQI
jgi:hypothetical protein